MSDFPISPITSPCIQHTVLVPLQHEAEEEAFSPVEERATLSPGISFTPAENTRKALDRPPAGKEPLEKAPTLLPAVTSPPAMTVPSCIPMDMEISTSAAEVQAESRSFPGARTDWKTMKLPPPEIDRHFQKAQRIFSQHEKFKAEFDTSLQGQAESLPSSQELAAIKDYTGGVFEHLNRYLRGNRTFFQKLLALGTLGRYTTALTSSAKLITSGLNRLPAYQDKNVYRATHIPDEAYNSYKPGSVITEHGFTSCSKTMKGIRIQPSHVVFVIRSREGRDIQKFSISPHEEEVLFRPETRFKVLSKETGETPFGPARFVYLEEMA
jgi:hypothetical protein